MGVCILVHKQRELICANESCIDENRARGKNEFNVRLANETSPG
jgi:hypothetical protein